MPAALRLTFLAIALFSAAQASSQTTYRWIDPASGGTVISDLPPPTGAKLLGQDRARDSAPTTQIPYATRQAAEKFPVTLYTSLDCGDGCKQAHDLLAQRGIPFTEKTVKTQDEIDALSKQQGKAASVPSLIVGRQSLIGFEATAWNDLFDLAGYPKTAPYRAKAVR